MQSSLRGMAQANAFAAHCNMGDDFKTFTKLSILMSLLMPVYVHNRIKTAASNSVVLLPVFDFICGYLGALLNRLRKY